MNDGKSGKDYDKALWAYTKNLRSGVPKYKYETAGQKN